MKIIQETDSLLFERKELVLEMEYSRAPSFPRIEIKRRIAKKFNVKENLISIKEIKTRFGGKYIKIFCNIYKNEDQLKKLEIPKKKDLAKKEGSEPLETKAEKSKEKPKENAKETKEAS